MCNKKENSRSGVERLFHFWKERQNLIDAMLRSNLSGMLVERAVSLAK